MFVLPGSYGRVGDGRDCTNRSIRFTIRFTHRGVPGGNSRAGAVAALARDVGAGGFLAAGFGESAACEDV